MLQGEYIRGTISYNLLEELTSALIIKALSRCERKRLGRGLYRWRWPKITNKPVTYLYMNCFASYFKHTLTYAAVTRSLGSLGMIAICGGDIWSSAWEGVGSIAKPPVIFVPRHLSGLKDLLSTSRTHLISSKWTLV